MRPVTKYNLISTPGGGENIQERRQKFAMVELAEALNQASSLQAGDALLLGKLAVGFPGTVKNAAFSARTASDGRRHASGEGGQALAQRVSFAGEGLSR